MNFSTECLAKKRTSKSIGDNCVRNTPDFREFVINESFNFAETRNRQLKSICDHRGSDASFADERNSGRPPLSRRSKDGVFIVVGCRVSQSIADFKLRGELWSVACKTLFLGSQYSLVAAHLSHR